MHSSFVLPSTSATAKAAVKVSPAPVVSRTLAAEIMVCLIGFSPSMNKADPLAPSFTRTCFTPWKYTLNNLKFSANCQAWFPISETIHYNEMIKLLKTKNSNDLDINSDFKDMTNI